MGSRVHVGVGGRLWTLCELSFGSVIRVHPIRPDTLGVTHHGRVVNRKVYRLKTFPFEKKGLGRGRKVVSFNTSRTSRVIYDFRFYYSYNRGSLHYPKKKEGHFYLVAVDMATKISEKTVLLLLERSKRIFLVFKVL